MPLRIAVSAGVECRAPTQPLVQTPAWINVSTPMEVSVEASELRAAVMLDPPADSPWNPRPSSAYQDTINTPTTIRAEPTDGLLSDRTFAFR